MSAGQLPTNGPIKTNHSQLMQVTGYKEKLVTRNLIRDKLMDILCDGKLHLTKELQESLDLMDKYELFNHIKRARAELKPRGYDLAFRLSRMRSPGYQLVILVSTED